MSAVPGAPEPFLRAAAEVVGRRHVVVDPQVTSTHAIDWTGRYRAAPVPVIRPGDTAEVAALVATAREHGVALVPQGGNTGLAGGGVPLDGGVVVDLRRLDTVTDVDPLGGQLTAGAGTTIAAVQAAAIAAGWEYGVDWAARETATVGGSVATDAGGLRFIRHGGTRRQLLGVEAVLGTASLVRHLPAVEKDNTGYDLGALLCGSEGTLGLVTAARLRLVRSRGSVACALIGFSTVGGAVEAASQLRRQVSTPEAIELMVDAGVELVCSTMGLPAPFSSPAPAVLLVEVSSDADPLVVLADAVGALAGVVGAAVAADEPQRRSLWRYRELHTEAIARLGPAHKLDVTLPARALAAFVTDAPRLVAAVAPGSRTWCFGHAADGNVHVNVTGIDPDDGRVDAAVLEEVARLHGSISAEHGIGRAKRRWLHLAHGPAELAVMGALKATFDPDGICNPGVLL